MSKLLLCVISLILSLLSGLNLFVYGDIFTSIADLQRLTDVEKEIPDLINNYINMENQRLENLRRF
jgi:hypothetical protein